MLWWQSLTGLAIFVGVLIALSPHLSKKGTVFLNSFSSGVILLTIVVTLADLRQIESLLGHGLEKEVFLSDVAGIIISVILFVLGLLAGILGMVLLEKKYLENFLVKTPAFRANILALVISLGFGLRNLSQGLSIGHEFLTGGITFSLILLIGYCLKLTLQGVSIVAPVASEKSSLKFLFLVGIIAGGPWALSTFLSQIWYSETLKIFSFSLATGLLIYSLTEVVYFSRKSHEILSQYTGLLIGLLAMLVLELWTFIASI